MIKIIMLCVFLMSVTTYINAGTKVERYKSFDGQEFESEKECKDHEEIEKKIIEIFGVAEYGLATALIGDYNYLYTLKSTLRIILRGLLAKNKKIIIQDISQ